MSMSAMSDHEAYTINQLAQQIHQDNLDRGWYDDSKRLFPENPEAVSDKYLIPTKIALGHSELSEGLEGHRKGLMDDHLPHRPMLEVELADALIRIMDMAGYLGYDLGGAIQEKLEYNSKREDHKRETRAAEGGKSV